MRPYERRAVGAYPYYTLAKWSKKSFCWVDNPKPYPTKLCAVQGDKAKGKYKVTEVTESGRVDAGVFEI